MGTSVWTTTASAPFTPREASYVVHAAQGESDKQIARHWGTSVKNVHNIAQSARDRLHVYNRTALVAEAIRQGFMQTVKLLLILSAVSALYSDSQQNIARLSRTRSGYRGQRMRLRARRQNEGNALDWDADTNTLVLIPSSSGHLS